MQIFSPSLLISLVPAAQAQQVTVPMDTGWEELSFGRKPGNRYTTTPAGEIEVESETSVSMLYTALPSLDLQATPALAWRWRLDQTFPATDLNTGGGDDRPLVIFVAFPYDPAVASTWERVVRPIVELVKGRDAPGRAIAYIWGGSAPRGSWVDSPHMRTAGGMVVLRSGDSPTGQWFDERVDLAADYQAFFGALAPPPSHIAIGADTDDTGSHSRGQVAELRFVAP